MKRSTRWTVKTCAALSGILPSRIIFVSNVSRQVHVQLGYPAQKTVVIPNGYNMVEFAPDPAARAEMRAELHINPGAPVVGLVARFDPQKDHLNFIQAAEILRSRLPQASFVLCGEGITWGNLLLAGWIRERRLEDCVHLLGRRTDVARVMNSMDVLASSSAAEALPNVIGEAMACGLPCVVTDAGDSGLMVAEVGRVVPVRDSIALADGLYAVLSLQADERAALGRLARRRVETSFSLERSAQAYNRLYREVLQKLPGMGQV
jgi:glycosyltransferase involved in cell wall biosynthesis